MGEMADYAIEQGMDMWFAHMAGQCLEECVYDEPEQRHLPKTKVACRYCKSTKVHWEQKQGRWRLVTDSGALHSCKEMRTRRNHDTQT